MNLLRCRGGDSLSVVALDETLLVGGGQGKVPAIFPEVGRGSTVKG